MSRILSYGSLNLDYVYHVPTSLLQERPSPPAAGMSTAAGKDLTSQSPLPGQGPPSVTLEKLGRMDSFWPTH